MLNVAQIEANGFPAQKVFQTELPNLMNPRLPMNAFADPIKDLEFHSGLRALADDLVNCLAVGGRYGDQNTLDVVGRDQAVNVAGRAQDALPVDLDAQLGNVIIDEPDWLVVPVGVSF